MMNDLQKECEALKEKLAELEARIESEQNNDDEWPRLGDVYWYETPCVGGVLQAIWTGHYADFHHKDTGNCFHTKEEAEFHLERLKVMAELERLSDGKDNPDAYYIKCDGLVLPYSFSSDFQAQKACKIVGEERLRKYWFGVKEETSERNNTSTTR